MTSAAAPKEDFALDEESALGKLPRRNLMHWRNATAPGAQKSPWTSESPPVSAALARMRQLKAERGSRPGSTLSSIVRHAREAQSRIDPPSPGKSSLLDFIGHIDKNLTETTQETITEQTPESASDTEPLSPAAPSLALRAPPVMEPSERETEPLETELLVDQPGPVPQSTVMLPEPSPSPDSAALPELPTQPSPPASPPAAPESSYNSLTNLFTCGGEALASVAQVTTAGVRSAYNAVGGALGGAPASAAVMPTVSEDDGAEAAWRAPRRPFEEMKDVEAQVRLAETNRAEAQANLNSVQQARQTYISRYEAGLTGRIQTPEQKHGVAKALARSGAARRAGCGSAQTLAPLSLPIGSSQGSSRDPSRPQTGFSSARVVPLAPPSNGGSRVGLRLEGMRRPKMPDFRPKVQALDDNLPPPRPPPRVYEASEHSSDFDAYGFQRRNLERVKRRRRAAKKAKAEQAEHDYGRRKARQAWFQNKYLATTWTFHLSLASSMTAVSMIISYLAWSDDPSSIDVSTRHEATSSRAITMWIASGFWLTIIIEPGFLLWLIFWELRPKCNLSRDFRPLFLDFLDDLGDKWRDFFERLKIRIGIAIGYY